MPTIEDIRLVVIECLKKLLGKKAIGVEITDKIDPIQNLGLESVDGIGFACELGQRLNCHIPVKVNPLVNDATCRSRKVGEIVTLLHSMLMQQEEVNARQ